MTIRVGDQGFKRQTIVKIFDQTLAATGNFDVTGIPANFTSLKAVLLSRSDNASGTEDTADIILNGDTTVANYRRAFHLAGFTHTSGQDDSITIISIPNAGSPANYFGVSWIDIPFYTETFNKIVSVKNRFRFEAANIRQDDRSYQWENTATINQITIQPDGFAADEFVVGSRLMIYGIY
jgi:hypothetical protein